MTGQRSMIHFDIHFEVLIQIMSFQEADDGFGVYIILMFGGFHRFGLDQECTGEAFAAGIVAGKGQHPCKVFLFTFLVRVQQRHIAFTSTPKYIVHSTKFDGCVDGVLDLNGSTCHYVEIRIGCGTVHVACMAEYVGSTPQQFDACFRLFLFGVCHNSFQVGFVFFDAIGFFAKVDVVETIVFDAHFLHELKACIHFVFGGLHFVCTTVPRELLRTTAKLVATFRTEGMPPCHGKFQPIFHLFSHHHFFSIVIAECHWVHTLFSFELNFSYSGKILFCCHNLNLFLEFIIFCFLFVL